MSLNQHRVSVTLSNAISFVLFLLFVWGAFGVLEFNQLAFAWMDDLLNGNKLRDLDYDFSFEFEFEFRLFVCLQFSN